MAFSYEIPGVKIEEVGPDPFWFACDEEHFLAQRKTTSTNDLIGHEILLLENGHYLKEHAIDVCRLASRNHVAAFSGTSLLTLVQMTRAGLGATLLSQIAIKGGLAENSGLVAIPFEKPLPCRKIGVAWRKGSGRRDEVNAVAGIMKQLFR